MYFVLQGDYRQLVHELDQYQYCELRLVVLDICNTYVRHVHNCFISTMYREENLYVKTMEIIFRSD